MNRTFFQAKNLRMAALAFAMFAMLFAGTIHPLQAQTYTPLYDFGVSDTGQANPIGQLALGRDGNFYGTMGLNYSQIYRITPGGVETLLWSAPGEPAYETVCTTGLTLGADGLFYGTCNTYGANNWASGGSGIIFKFDPNAGFTVLYSFPECNSDGWLYPSALTLGTDGNFYGTTIGNGFCSNPYGTVFRVTPTGTFTTLRAFKGSGSGDGDAPIGGLTLGADGNFYGTTQTGGNSGYGSGTVFKITPKGKIKYIYNFANAGYYPEAGVTQGADGKFYGTTTSGGAYSDGTIFQLTAAGKIKYLHDFNYAVDDVAGPTNPLTLGSDGNLYGPANCYSWGCGSESLYKITTKGVYTDLYNGFTNPEGACPDWSVTGCYLSSPMALNPNGIFYGTTMQGGDYQNQTIGRGVFYSFSTGLKPYIVVQFPRGTVGQSIGVFGQGFTKATAVAFNGKAATFKVVSDTYMTATIPTGATKGYVTVTMPSGTLKSSIKLTVVK